MFEEWLLQVLCEDVDKYGLTPYVHFDESIRKNLVLVRLAIGSLFLPDDSFEQSQNALPAPIASVCGNRRTQAKRFLRDFLHHAVPEKGKEMESGQLARVDAVMVN